MPKKTPTLSKSKTTILDKIQKNWKILLVICVGIFVGLIQLTMYLSQNQNNNSQTSPNLNTITSEDLNRGWYWGNKDQKKVGTPDTWFYEEAGRSSKWYKPETKFPTYKCPTNGWVDCMPGPGELKYECTAEAQRWFKANCPNFEGVAY